MKTPSTEAGCRSALEELVACKDLKNRIDAMSWGGFKATISSTGAMVYEPRKYEHDKLAAEYARRKSLAWEAARAALSAASPLPERCEHGVWASDHCYQCHQAEASPRGAVQRQDGDTEDARDAARYRWLREHKHYAILIGDEGFDYEYGQVEHWSNEQNEAKVDAAIDAALKEHP